MKSLTISGHYADYNKAADAKAAFLAGKDFTVHGMISNGMACNLSDCQREGVEQVSIRYRNLTMQVIVNIPKA